ncbi:hypothetical protein JTB14_007166 [Gonioctena quinquepunctata]|nr:hypothetical protein JTB14_007166 [Gonioctena quinquepunctata]
MSRGKKNSEDIHSDFESNVNKVCSTSMDKLENRINLKMDQMIIKLYAKLDPKINELLTSITQIGKDVSSNKKAIHVLEDIYDILEQHCKRNSLRLNGVPDTDKDNLLDIVKSVFQNHLGISCSTMDFDGVFRIGEPSRAHPRGIIVNFVSGVERNDVIYARRALKDTGLSVYEDLTKHRYDLLSAAKKLGNNQAWSSNGKVYIWRAHENKRRIVASVGDL